MPPAAPAQNIQLNDKKYRVIEIILLAAGLLIFYTVTDRKDIGYAVGVLGGIGILGVTFFNPRLGLISVLGLLFIECTINTINALAQTAVEFDLSGLPMVVMTQWFAFGVLILFVVFYLAYMCREFLRGKDLRPLNRLEWSLFVPFLAALTYLPISMLNGNDFLLYCMDIIPLCIYAGIIAMVRVFENEKNYRALRYYYLDWFVIFNLAILIPLWAYNFIYDPFRNGLVGITAIRYATGPYDFNFFLVPILGMVLTHDDHLDRNRRGLYQFAFITCLARVVISLFRGAMVGTFIAILIATALVESARRWKWIRSLLKIFLAVIIILAFLVATIPAARATFNIALVKRLEQALNTGAGSGSLQFRQVETAAAIEDIRSNPILGFGPGTEVTKYFNPNERAKIELYLHSSYVWFWFKMGILGVFALVLFFTGIFGVCIKLLRRKLHAPDRGWVIGTLAATIAMLPVIHTNNMLIRSQGAYALMLLLFGLCLIFKRYNGLPPDVLPASEGSNES